MPEADAINMTLVGLLFTLGAGFLFVLLPRRLAILPLIASACFITLGQQVVASSLHFTALRIVVLFGWLRLVVRGELLPPVKVNAMDKLIIVYACVGFILYNILWQSSGALINQLGFLYNTLGIYFLCRFLIRDPGDIRRTIKMLALCLIPLAGFMILEAVTGRNIFSVLGGVAEKSVLRDGYVRSQGPFRHAILAGTVGAVSLPLLAALLADRANGRVGVVLGITASTAIAVTSHSSGPALAFGFGIIGLLAWILRRHMRTIRWGIVFVLVALHLVMKVPVWFLVSKISDLIGGGGWHRSYLMDQAIRHVDEWWLIGTKYTAHWMPTALVANQKAADITNQFVAEGVMGGLLRMCLFIWIIVIGFRTVGRTVRVLEGTARSLAFLAWSTGACLLAHIASFFAVSYFDQIIVFWYILLAFIAALNPLSSPPQARNRSCAYKGPDDRPRAGRAPTSARLRAKTADA